VAKIALGREGDRPLVPRDGSYVEGRGEEHHQFITDTNNIVNILVI